MAPKHRAKRIDPGVSRYLPRRGTSLFLRMILTFDTHTRHQRPDPIETLLVVAGNDIHRLSTENNQNAVGQGQDFL